ncbi:unnamed protein product, partial [Adineta steineri]
MLCRSPAAKCCAPTSPISLPWRFSVNEYENLSQQSNRSEEERSKLDEEIQERQRKQAAWDQSIVSFNDDINVNDDTIRTKQST